MLELFLLTANQVPLVQMVRAEVFFSEEQAVHQIFPTLVMAAKTQELTEAQFLELKKNTELGISDRKIRYFVSPTGEMVFIDRVMGKHEIITYAVGIDRNGAVHQIEIMEYKEKYGGEIRRSDWKRQFNGKTRAAKLKLSEDIQNVSGATLSCKHVTDGVKRVLKTYELIQR